MKQASRFILAQVRGGRAFITNNEGAFLYTGT